MFLSSYIINQSHIAKSVSLYVYKNYSIASILTRVLKKTRKDTGFFDIVRPGNVSDIREVPDYIIKPEYVFSGKHIPGPSKPEIKSADQIASMRDSCKLAKMILNVIGENIEVGKTTDYLDSIAHDLCLSNGAYPSPLLYMNFPKSICTSVNNVACHGIPDDRPLKNGDIVNVDVTVFLNGFHGDCSETFLVGDVDESGKYLVASTKKCLNEAISICGPGVRFNKIGQVIENFCKAHNLTVCPSFLGHGIGQYFHGAPDIYHCSNSYGGTMQAGMTFTIEPVLSLGSSSYIEILDDGWTAITEDNSRTAQEEHTILITDKGYDILTL
uniref:Methionine aminopeptidase n=1 Tax=Xenopsylla cheopis TaxID=163159 RepID=A0A6M2DI57_XENCH